MRSYFRKSAFVLLLVSPLTLAGCGTGAAVPAASSAASEAADAAGGMNKTDLPAKDAPQGEAPAADAPKTEAADAPPAGEKKAE